jgi:hypothetical protein
MLSAKKEDKGLPFRAMDLSSQTSLGKVAGSIHSLRERLEDVSLEQIIAADEKLKTSVARLLTLQKMLTTVTEMKQTVALTKEQISAAAFETSQTSNLIRFPTHNRLSGNAVQESRQAVVRLDRRSDPTETLQTGQSTNALSEAASPAVNQTGGLVEWIQAAPAALASENDSQSGDPLPSRSRNSVLAQFTMGKQNTEPEENPVQIMPAPVPSQKDLPGETEHSLSAAIATTDKRPDSESETHFVAGDFDQQLLHDLIKDYGEFVVSPNLPAATEQHHPSDRTTSPKSRSSAPSRAKDSPGANTLPNHRHRGELDQKLKKLIKDYGEYDLYSHQTPSKLRRGVLAAFLLLAAVFSTIYFVSGRTSNAPSSQASARQSEDATSRTSPELSTAAEIEGASVAKRRSSASVETPNTTETGEPSALKNKAVPKKKTTKAGPDS